MSSDGFVSPNMQLPRATARYVVGNSPRAGSFTIIATSSYGDIYTIAVNIAAATSPPPSQPPQSNEYTLEETINVSAKVGNVWYAGLSYLNLTDAVYSFLQPPTTPCKIIPEVGPISPVTKKPYLFYAHVKGTPTEVGNFTIYISHTAPGVPERYYYVINVTVTDGAQPPPVVEPPTAGPPAATTFLTWLQAEFLARLGHKIRRVGWSNRYLEFDGFFWWQQSFDPISKAQGALTVPTAATHLAADFRASDWTVDGIDGQTVPEADLTAAVAIKTRFP